MRRSGLRLDRLYDAVGGTRSERLSYLLVTRLLAHRVGRWIFGLYLISLHALVLFLMYHMGTSHKHVRVRAANGAHSVGMHAHGHSH